MNPETPIYGHSRGYRFLAGWVVIGLLVSLRALTGGRGMSPVALGGTIGFAALSWHALVRAFRRVAVLRIDEDGLAVTDPALNLGVIAWEEIAVIRIHATLLEPTVALRLNHPDIIRRRAPAAVRLLLKPLWALSHFQVTVQLENLDDQVAALKSAAVSHGVPVISELI